MRWRGDMALHEVVQEGMAARRGEGTWHCMWWRGDMALHEVGEGDMALHEVARGHGTA